ncbi:dienelactone hydrolase family protein [Nonomuraea sp. NPDC050536]|uniref:dienelactone hydrolase family protein n=1 Tax=Nonomuraea sp. NPDC050536 TaxID=3364366 RepID=UPI0037C6B446
MCHSDDSRPPAPPVVGEVASHGPLELTAADGNRFMAYRADPASPNGRSIVLLPDVRGLHPFYRDLAIRFAEAGFPTVAIDYFGRTAGLGERPSDFDFMSHVRRLTSDNVRADAVAATALLSGPVFTVGFCMGGGQSLRQAIEGNGLAGGIGFYPVLRVIDDVPDTPGSPVLLLRAGADTATTPEAYDAFTAALDRVGTPHETHIYEGAPHSFFDRAYAEWAEACQDAWHRILTFTKHHT